jgi:hypothetical protein
LQCSFSTIRTRHVAEDISQSLTAQQRNMEAAATSLQGQLQIVQKPTEDLHTSQVESQDHKSTLLRQFVGKMAAIRNSQALSVDLVEKTHQEDRAQRVADTGRIGVDVYYGYNDQSIQMRDNPEIIIFGTLVRIGYCRFCYSRLGIIIVLFSTLIANALSELLAVPTLKVSQTVLELHSILDVSDDTAYPMRLHQRLSHPVRERSFWIRPRQRRGEGEDDAYRYWLESGSTRLLATVRHRGIAVIGRQDGRPGSLHIQYHETRNLYLEAMLSRDLLV